MGVIKYRAPVHHIQNLPLDSGTESITRERQNTGFYPDFKIDDRDELSLGYIPKNSDIDVKVDTVGPWGDKIDRYAMFFDEKQKITETTIKKDLSTCGISSNYARINLDWGKDAVSSVYFKNG